MEAPTVARRSACDRCRSKRVRCPRAWSSTAPCSRCINAGAPCITGFPGNPGRPRKARQVEATATPQPTSAAMHVDASLPAYWPPPINNVRNEHHLGVSEGASPALSVNDPTAWFGPGAGSEGMMLNLANDSLGHAPFHPHGNVDSSPESNSNFWAGFNLPQADANHAASMTDSTPFEDFACTPQQQQQQQQRQVSLDTPDNINLLPPGPLQCPDKLNMYSGLHQTPDTSMSLAQQQQQPTLGNRLVRFREKVDQNVTNIGIFFSDPQMLVDDCVDAQSNEPAAPVAIVLKGIREFTDILQSLRAVASRPSGDVTSDTSSCSSPSSLSLKSETVLLVLSCHLALLRLCNSLFHGSSQYFVRMPPRSLKSIKVKAVLRIGSVSSLQDMPAKAYAMGVADIVQTQIQQLERLLGIPAAYCVPGVSFGKSEAGPSLCLPPTLGIFKGEERTQLLQTVMEQEDVSSCVRSIRDNLQTTLAFLE